MNVTEWQVSWNSLEQELGVNKQSKLWEIDIYKGNTDSNRRYRPPPPPFQYRLKAQAIMTAEGDDPFWFMQTSRGASTALWRSTSAAFEEGLHLVVQSDEEMSSVYLIKNHFCYHGY